MTSSSSKGFVAKQILNIEKGPPTLDVPTFADIERPKKKMTFSCLNLNAVPESIFDHDNIVHLDLSYNRLTNIPGRISKFKCLETLNLSHNELSSLPIELFTLRSLKTLDVKYNLFTSLPPLLLSMLPSTNWDFSNNNMIDIAREGTDISFDVTQNALKRRAAQRRVPVGLILRESLEYISRINEEQNIGYTRFEDPSARQSSSRNPPQDDLNDQELQVSIHDGLAKLQMESKTNLNCASTVRTITSTLGNRFKAYVIHHKDTETTETTPEGQAIQDLDDAIEPTLLCHEELSPTDNF